MRHAAVALFVAASLTGLGACDFVRFPGDGGPPPAAPEPPPEIPEGAPGPPPPGFGETETPDVPVDPAPEETSLPTDPLPEGTETPAPSEPENPAPDTATPAPDETGPVTEPGVDPVPEPGPISDEETVPAPAPTPVFSYYAPGALLPGTGGGFPDQLVHAPDIVFPISVAPAYLQSQVFMPGGGVAGGDQCDASNFNYPWRDNFCETRTANRSSPFCPTPKIHQGQDIRVGSAADCNTVRRQPSASRGLHEVVAVEDGIISSIGTYTVKLRSGGRIYNYMHLNMGRLAVTAGQSVRAGDPIGFVSNDFGGTPTTLHLHFEIIQNTAENGWSHVPPYLSLVAAYERRENGPGERLDPEIGVASADMWVIPEGMEIIE